MELPGHMLDRALPPLAVELALHRGYDLSGLRARQVRAADLRTYDLVLAMARDHLNWLRRLNRGDARVERFLEYATDGRRRKDVPDPFGGEARDYEGTLDLLESAMPKVLENLRADYPRIG